MPSRVYLDHAATTPLRPSARAAMADAFAHWANPSSPHSEGRAARAALEAARMRIADLLGWRGAILFTSGASEGIAMVMARAVAGRRIVSTVEHDAVRRVAGDAISLPVGADGRVTDVGLALALEQAGEAPLVAVQLVNSETGVIQPADAIAAAVRAGGGLWLCDATQAVGKMDLPDADFIAFSAHKFGGPPGVGALLVRDLATLAPSGGQEQGYRGGTENLPSVAGMAAALAEGRGWMERIAELRAHLDGVIEEAGGEIVARDAPRLPTIASYRMPGMSAAAQLIRFDSAGFAVSAGSACSSGSLKPSHVLAAMGLDAATAGEVIRVSFGRTTRREDVWRFADQWRAIAADAKARIRAGGGMIYLDYQATTPLAPEALAAMRPLWEEGFGNPHSPHRMGRAAKAAVELARDRIAAPFGPGGRLMFTSGATEALNWAIKGIAETSLRRRIVTTAIEHAAVLDTVAWLGRRGHEIIVLPVDRHGIVDLDAARAAIDGDTALVAAMLVNNEIGTIQPIAALGAMARAAGGVMICDAVQGYGRVPLPVGACDLITISAHKIHGPKGIGALWMRDGIEPAPLMHGGGQEGGLRSGTLAPALCAGFGAAAELAFERIEADAEHVEALWQQARASLDGWTLNGSVEQRWHGNLNLRRDGLDVSRLMADLRDIAFSAGSACASGSGRPSHVLEAIGLTPAEARASIRLGFGRYTTTQEIETAMTLIREAADRQQAFA